MHKPSRFGAIRFAVEYDLHMDVLPGDEPTVLGKHEPTIAKALPHGCTAHYYTGPKYDPITAGEWLMRKHLQTVAGKRCYEKA